jgi:hypothetical protein
MKAAAHAWYPENCARAQAVRLLPSPREAAGRVGEYRQVRAGVGGVTDNEVTPHPRPLPTTRFAHGGKGAKAFSPRANVSAAGPSRERIKVGGEGDRIGFR